jgi:hypothetical protein
MLIAQGHREPPIIGISVDDRFVSEGLWVADDRQPGSV